MSRLFSYGGPRNPITDELTSKPIKSSLAMPRIDCIKDDIWVLVCHIHRQHIQRRLTSRVRAARHARISPRNDSVKRSTSRGDVDDAWVVGFAEQGQKELGNNANGEYVHIEDFAPHLAVVGG